MRALNYLYLTVYLLIPIYALPVILQHEELRIFCHLFIYKSISVGASNLMVSCDPPINVRRKLSDNIPHEFTVGWREILHFPISLSGYHVKSEHA